MVESLGHGVTGIARTHKEAIALFEQQKRAWCWPISSSRTGRRASMR